MVLAGSILAIYSSNEDEADESELTERLASLAREEGMCARRQRRRLLHEPLWSRTRVMEQPGNCVWIALSSSLQGSNLCLSCFSRCGNAFDVDKIGILAAAGALSLAILFLTRHTDSQHSFSSPLWLHIT